MQIKHFFFIIYKLNLFEIWFCEIFTLVLFPKSAVVWYWKKHAHFNKFSCWCNIYKTRNSRRFVPFWIELWYLLLRQSSIFFADWQHILLFQRRYRVQATFNVFLFKARKDDIQNEDLRKRIHQIGRRRRRRKERRLHSTKEGENEMIHNVWPVY